MDKNTELNKLMATKILDLAEKLYVARMTAYWEKGGAGSIVGTAGWFNECLELARIAIEIEANSDPV
jgi:hypothetical protein